MSLTTPSMASVIRKQYKYKLRSYIGMFNSLMMLQVLAILISLGATGGRGSSNSWISINVDYYSGDTVIGFTIIWGFISAIIITTKAYREDDFVLITNRLSSNVSNMLFLVSGSVIGGITAILAGCFIRVIRYFVFDSTVIYYGNVSNVQEMFMGLGATIMFILLLSSLGYFIGTVVQLHKSLVVLVPVIIIGFLIAQGSLSNDYLLLDLTAIYFQETSFLLLLCKVIVSAGLLFSGSIIISNRMEVKR
ncbi:hypothetical protein [Virgibacillus oceani]|uniref:Uncharacterized protein n=1 Tax=Virgibacillus oceani TaxID=1479511 RepID=A0A917HIH3_9BACI|nr:hypothetical protein [Virgibacillus oceani]GGG80406.1 hypothetical protein GCM10011398_27240 [Virgibacillus oceani]